MDVMTVLVTLVLGVALGAGAVQASLWWRRHELRTAEAALQRRKVAFEARRVQWERRESRQELARV
jgi:hypothetical protein